MNPRETIEWKIKMGKDEKRLRMTIKLQLIQFHEASLKVRTIGSDSSSSKQTNGSLTKEEMRIDDHQRGWRSEYQIQRASKEEKEER